MAFSVLEQIEAAKEPLSVARLAKIYGVGRDTIYRAIEQGKIPVINNNLDTIRIDPCSLAYEIRKRNPVMKMALAGK